MSLAGTAAIETRFHGPTTYRGSRYSAVCCNCQSNENVAGSGVVYVNTDHALDPHENAQLAAVKHYETHHGIDLDDGRGHRYYARVSESGHGIRRGWAFPLIPE